MVKNTERRIAEVHQLLDPFELRVLARPTPQVDVSNLLAAVESLQADIDRILEVRVRECETLSAEPAEDTVMAALIATSKTRPPPSREHAKRRKG